jgi:16S rRNA processing protein RimM
MELVVGRVGRPHGLRGEVTVEVRTDDPDQRFAAGSVLATEPANRGPLTIASARWHRGLLLVSFTGCTDRAAAETLRGTMLAVDADQLGPPADPDEFYDHQLIGLRVETVSGDVIGRVTDVLHHGQDVLVVEAVDVPPGSGQPRRGGELLIPFVAPIVPHVDVDAGRIVIDPPPGLLDPELAI